MTFGIDIATPQAGIDLGRAKAEGVEFVVVKMGGLNVTPQYVAPYYRAQVDRVVAAGLPKGHYYLIGAGQSPEQQAEFFVANLYRFDPAHDVLALDNEALDGNGTKWVDADAARFIRRVLELTKVKPEQVWHYAGAVDYRAGVWPEVAATGARFWWAAYGSYPTGQTPDHEPNLQGCIPRWDVHQFTSRSRVAGFDVDGNYSPIAVGDLFGGGMTSGYANVNNFVVILADNRDPYVSWANHLARGSAGGVDVVAAVGTPLYAPADCVVANTLWNGTAGHTVTMSFADGWRDQFMHLSAFVEPGFKRKGELVGYSGRTASGQVNGVDPHVHWHRIDPSGVRRNPWYYFAGSSPSGDGYTPIEEDDMFTDEDRTRLNAAYAALYGARNLTGKDTALSWVNIDGSVQKSNYGVLPIILHNQTLIAQQAAKIAALQSAISQVSGGSVDPAVVEAAAKAGAEAALQAAAFPTVDAIADAVVDEQHNRLSE